MRWSQCGATSRRPNVVARCRGPMAWPGSVARCRGPMAWPGSVAQFSDPLPCSQHSAAAISAPLRRLPPVTSANPATIRDHVAGGCSHREHGIRLSDAAIVASARTITWEPLTVIRESFGCPRVTLGVPGSPWVSPGHLGCPRVTLGFAPQVAVWLQIQTPSQPGSTAPEKTNRPSTQAQSVRAAVKFNVLHSSACWRLT